MAGAILELYNDKEKAILLGQNARETALKRHDKDTVINDIIYNYNKIINDSKGE
jgi:hypothetical protein